MTGARPGLMSWAPVVTLSLLILPVLAGLAGTLAPAFGYMPVLGGQGVSLLPFRELLEWPGFGAAVRLSVVTGVVATLASLAMALCIVAALQGRRAFGVMVRLLSPLLSVPHAAAALGLAFVIAPSGWIARALSPWATGWVQPPDLLIVQDPWGLSLIGGLVVKEVPFLLLMLLSALVQVRGAQRILVAQSLGYGQAFGWLKAVLPAVYPQVRLPVMAVLVYSMTAVDVGMILGPTLPPPLSVQVVHWMSDPDLSLRFRAAAGAVVQVGLVAAVLAVLWLAEAVARRLGRAWTIRGGRGRWADGPARVLAFGCAFVAVVPVSLGVAGLALWSVAGMWRFPAVLPTGYTLKIWAGQGMGLWQALGTSALIAVAATAVALVLVVACLQSEYRLGRQGAGRALWVLYLPLLVPQVAFLPGLQVLALILGGGGLIGVIAVHVVFVLPYVFLSLADPWRAWDARAGLVAASLRAGPARVLWAVRLPMLLRAVLTAAAVGFAVSVGQYLPTLLIGGGRVVTLTTEAVALASGGNKRLIGAFALMQLLLPFAAFGLAVALPAVVFRRRRGMAA